MILLFMHFNDVCSALHFPLQEKFSKRRKKHQKETRRKTESCDSSSIHYILVFYLLLQLYYVFVCAKCMIHIKLQNDKSKWSLGHNFLV